LNEEHPYVNVNLELNSYSITFTGSVDEKCDDYLRIDLYKDGSWIDRESLKVNGNYSWTTEVDGTGNYQYKIRAGRC